MVCELLVECCDLPQIMSYDTIDEIKLVKGQKIVFLNVRSLFANISTIQADFTGSEFMSLVFVESWLHAKIPTTMINIKGFTCVRLDRQNKRGGGIIIYVRDDLEWDSLQKKCFDISTANIELLSIVIKRKFQKSICLSGVYIPPKSNIDKAIESLDELGVIINKSNSEWIIGGDLNADLLDPNCKRNKKLVSHFASRNSLRQMISYATRRTTGRKSLLDHIC